jgi:glutaredoxin-like protein NrdH
MTTTTVRVYTKPDCKQCDLTKEALTKKGISFEVDDILEPANLAAAKSMGLMSAPVVVTEEDQWAGFRPDKIAELAARIEAEDR